MSNIHIEWLTDTMDHCECCGYSWAEGAMVTLDGAPFLHLKPFAGCTGSDHWDQAEVYRLIIEALGHNVTEQ